MIQKIKRANNLKTLQKVNKRLQRATSKSIIESAKLCSIFEAIFTKKFKSLHLAPTVRRGFYSLQYLAPFEFSLCLF